MQAVGWQRGRRVLERARKSAQAKSQLCAAAVHECTARRLRTCLHVKVHDSIHRRHRARHRAQVLRDDCAKVFARGGFGAPQLAETCTQRGRELTLAHIGRGVHCREEPKFGMPRNLRHVASLSKCKGGIRTLEQPRQAFQRLRGSQVYLIQKHPVAFAQSTYEHAFHKVERKSALGRRDLSFSLCSSHFEVCPFRQQRRGDAIAADTTDSAAFPLALRGR
mmetsp:Transcript_6455/g.26213  ORF Transcript_6455/g.26213 Transcript_6455/m.26213 type:complete len:221 (+) Transcript_6455:15779-16441(+)